MREDIKKETLFAHLARPKPEIGTPVNSSITRASTLLFQKAEDLYRTDVRGYGRHGSQVHDDLALAFNALEGGAGTSLAASGLAACTLAILSVVKSGDHLLLTDSTYGPVRNFCLNYLKSMNVEIELYDPRIGSGIETLIQENTSVIWLESPGSLTFEIQDLPAIAKVARAKNVVTIIDNTWSAGLTLSPLNLGIDISVHSATKYFGGHGDVLFGAVISRTKDLAHSVSRTAKYLGYATSPDDAYQILRGFRSVISRFKQSETTSEFLAAWLETHPKVDSVLHPARPSHPDHALWKRDFTGGGCLFSIVLKPVTPDDVHAFINALDLFGIGYSYGGYESLAIQCDPQLNRVKTPKPKGPLVRFACGLENMHDLKADIENALNVLPERP